MGLYEFSRATQYIVEECCREGCGCLFAMTLDMRNRRLADKKSFFCPNGHPQLFVGEKETDRLTRELETSKKDIEWQRAARLRAERQASAARGQVTKIRNRIGNGVCPCCRRSFNNLRNHIKHMHPDFNEAV